MRGRHRPGLGTASPAVLQRARLRSGSCCDRSAVEGPERALLQGEGDSDGSAGQKNTNQLRKLERRGRRSCDAGTSSVKLRAVGCGSL